MALTKIKGAGVNISATEKLYFDDGGNTYIYESGADVLDVYVGGANMVKLTESTTDTVTVTGDLTVGVDGTGHDVKFFGDTASAYMLWDQSADDLVLAGAAGIDLAGDIDVDGTANLDVVDIDGAVDMASTLTLAGNADFNGDLDVDGTTNLDAVDIDGAVQLDATLTIGADDQGYDVIFYGDTASSNMTWDTSADDLILNDARLYINQDDNDTSIYIDSEASGEVAIEVYSKYGIYSNQDISGGRAAYFTRNIAESGSSPCVTIIDDHTSNTQPALKIQQDGAAPSIELAGNGSIKFPGTQGASSDANSLDDYEEGTWTPVFAGTGGTSGQSYGIQKGVYTKIGQLVVASFYLTLSDKGTITTILQLSGFPFSASSVSNVHAAAALGRVEQWTLNADHVLTLHMNNDAATAYFLQYEGTASSDGTDSVTTSHVNDTTSLMGTMSYIV